MMSGWETTLLFGGKASVRFLGRVKSMRTTSRSSKILRYFEPSRQAIGRNVKSQDDGFVKNHSHQSDTDFKMTRWSLVVKSYAHQTWETIFLKIAGWKTKNDSWKKEHHIVRCDSQKQWLMMPDTTKMDQLDDHRLLNLVDKPTTFINMPRN